MIFIKKEKNKGSGFSEDLLRKAVGETLSSEGITEEIDLTIVLTDDARLKSLNQDYLEINAPTDVLSFPSTQVDPESGSRYLGDILISVPRAEAQAKEAGHASGEEIQLLVVHGVLHLLGHDHAEKDDKDRMWSAQDRVLKKLGLGHIKVRED